MGTFRSSPRRLVAVVSAALVAAVVVASAARAGSLCGAVRDGATAAPVANAGIFLRHPGGSYAGYHGATDAAGRFCINLVPPGTYDLEVLVDDYRVGYIRNVTVTGDVTDVPILVSSAGLDFRRPFPNPAESRVTFQWVMPASASTRLAIFDAGGRLLSAWSGDLAPGVKSVTWDLRGPGGRRVPAGVYYARLESGGMHRVRRFVCLP